MIILRLFLSFFQVGLFAFGGGYAAMPLIQEQVVRLHPWLTLEAFADLVTLAEMTPGPIAINAATFVGMRVAGAPGAVAASVACVTPSVILVSLLSFVYLRWREKPLFGSVLGGLRAAVVAMIASAGLSILRLVLFEGGRVDAGGLRWTGAALFILAFLAIRKLRWNPILTMFLCGAAGLALGAAGLA